MKNKKQLNCPRCKAPYNLHTCFWTSCVGCPGGHSSFHRTITMSPEWALWEKENSRRMNLEPIGNCFDVDECRECGIMSPEHFKEFLEFVKTI